MDKKSICDFPKHDSNIEQKLEIITFANCKEIDEIYINNRNVPRELWKKINKKIEEIYIKS